MKKIIFTENAPKPIGPYSQAILLNDVLYASGQIAINPENDQLVLDNIIEETIQVMKNIGALLTAAGMDYTHIIKTSIFLKDMNNFGQVNNIYGSFFKGDFPARETVQVARLPKDVNVEISVIASF
ncbi:MAG: RidA family protein [Bacteroidetes bacterium]|nr:RidA family protein [Bacteroidota bacterium]MBL0052789.1 RidA family protein [Bacteroidota bacterium]